MDNVVFCSKQPRKKKSSSVKPQQGTNYDLNSTKDKVKHDDPTYDCWYGEEVRSFSSATATYDHIASAETDDETDVT